MRGLPDPQLAMLTTLQPGDLIPADHPIRRIRQVVDAVLEELDDEFTAMYASGGPAECAAGAVAQGHDLDGDVLDPQRAGVLPTAQLRPVVQVVPGHADRRAKAFDASTFSKNRQRLLDHDMADRFFALVVAQAKLRRYVTSDHFSVDGTLLEAWASHKSFQPKDGPKDPSGPGRNAEVSFHGQKRTNETHASTTDPEARMARKSFATAAKLSYAGHLLMEHRNALLVDIELTQATGHAECDAALEMFARLPETKRRRTVAGDKAYDTRGFVADLREMNITPHLAPNTTRQRSTVDGRTTRHKGHATSQRIRKRIEEPFRWIKTISGGRKLRYIGRARNRAWFLMSGAVYNILRIAALDARPA